MLFATEPAAGPAWRFSLDDVAGQAIDHRPTHVATDGSLQVYTLEDGRLWASADGGLTWQERGQSFGGQIRPELAGTPYEVLLGLLGNQLTAARRAAGEAPFNPVADPAATDVV